MRSREKITVSSSSIVRHVSSNNFQADETDWLTPNPNHQTQAEDTEEEHDSSAEG